jgi:hypothetical protein
MNNRTIQNAEPGKVRMIAETVMAYLKHYICFIKKIKTKTIFSWPKVSEISSWRETTI